MDPFSMRCTQLTVADEQESLGPSLSSLVAEARLYLKSESWRVRGSLLGD